MTHKMLSGLAVVIALVLTHAPADAQQFKQRKNAYASQTGGNGVQQGSQQLGANQQNSANMLSVYMGAYAYQIARKCLDNMMPECPKKK